MSDTKSDGAIGTGAINGANPVTGGTFGGTNGIGTGNANTGDPDTATIPTGSHGGGMGSGAGLDVDDLQDSVDGKPVMTDTKPADGAGTGNYANSHSDDEQSGVVGEKDGVTAGGGI
ncbi:MAG: hypothetical protein H8F28_28055 [Fibrella sp.]|nr:hypothetical protein [Armatimonadota bacterium]